MSLVINLFQVLQLRERGYRQLQDSNKNFGTGAFVVGLVGLVYGLSNTVVFRELLATMGSRTGEIIGAVAVVMSGMCMAYLVHLGVVMLIWAISKGFRGPGNFGFLYGNLGLAMLPLVLGVPLLNYLWWAGPRGLAYLLAVPFLVWLGAALVQAIRTAEGHSYGLATGVLVVTTIFACCLVYLWTP